MWLGDRFLSITAGELEGGGRGAALRSDGCGKRGEGFSEIQPGIRGNGGRP